MENALPAPPGASTPEAPEDAEHGRQLHREFVGMLFALAVAQVAIEGAVIVDHESQLWNKAPALTHLLLALVIIAASWVGWSRSAFSLAPVKHVISSDFVTLLLDVWLLSIYFFLVMGAEEQLTTAQGETLESASARAETLWVAIMFWSYLVWDLWTKRNAPAMIVQRGWASLACALLATAAFIGLAHVRGAGPVVLADLALLSLVLLFRAMKLHDLSAHSRGSWSLVAALFALSISFALMAR